MYSPNQPPDRFGVVVGYRRWKLMRSGIVGISHRLAWLTTNSTKAICRARQMNHKAEETPHFKCTCGLHAFLDHRMISRSGARSYKRAPWIDTVGGAVLAWGKIVYHEEASYFRAEYALPIAFYDAYFHPGHEAVQNKKVERIARVLNAPILRELDSLERYAKEELRLWTECA